MKKYDIKKNIKDLEFQHLLNIQNIVLGFIGALMITVVFIDSIPDRLPSKTTLIFTLLMIAFLFIFYIDKKLEKKKESIRRMQYAT